MSKRPSISVCIPTVRGWGPELRAVCDALAPQTAAVGGEVFVLDGSGRPEPPDGALPAAVNWRSVPRTSVARLRTDILAAAEGEIVAITEDHCRATDDWCALMLSIHREHPEIDVVGGSVDNDSRASALDWAAFYIGYVPDMPPLPIDRGPGQPRVSMINAAYKRRALAPKAGPSVAMNDARLQIWHSESYGVRGTTGVNFHSGRTVEGLRRDEVPERHVLRAVRALALPGPRVARRLLTGYRRGQPVGRLARSAPWMLWLAWVQSFGEALGALDGAGSSPGKVR